MVASAVPADKRSGFSGERFLGHGGTEFFAWVGCYARWDSGLYLVVYRRKSLWGCELFLENFVLFSWLRTAFAVDDENR